MPHTPTCAHGHGRRAVPLHLSLRSSYRPAPPADGLHARGVRVHVQPCSGHNLAKNGRRELGQLPPHSPAPTPQPRTLKHIPQILDPTDPPRPPSSSRAFPHRVCVLPCVRRIGPAASGRVPGIAEHARGHRGEPRRGTAGRLRRLPSRAFLRIRVEVGILGTPCVHVTGPSGRRAAPHAPQSERGPRGERRRGAGSRLGWSPTAGVCGVGVEFVRAVCACNWAVWTLGRAPHTPE